MQKILSCALPCPWVRLTSVWESLRESCKSCKNTCNERRRDIKRPTKRSKLSIKK